MKFSALSLLRHALTGNRDWTPHWRDAAPKPSYDVVIGGGNVGHGLATAYYLAREFGIRNVALLEKGWIGGGNVGRNTTIVRSNYLLPGNLPFYETSLKLWEGLALARLVRRRWRAIRILLTSGFPDTDIDDGSQMGENFALLSKPYRKPELAKALRAAFDGPG